MNQDNISPMEEEIASEEVTNEENQKRPEPKSKAGIPKMRLHFTLTKPKIITLVILFMIILATYFALLLLSANKPEENLSSIPTNTTTYSPKPLVDPETAALINKVETYNKKLDTLNNYPKKLAPPSVQLDISFEK